MKKQESWNEKLYRFKPHKVKTLHVDIAGMKAGQAMLVPSAQIVDQFIRTIPLGSKMSVKDLRINIAKQYDAEVTCPITTGFCLKIVAEAAYENYASGMKLDEVTPFWRVIDENTPTLNKLSFGKEFLINQWKDEGLL